MSRLRARVFRSGRNGEWFFHIRAGNQRIICQSEGYKQRASAVKALKALFDANAMNVDVDVPEDRRTFYRSFYAWTRGK